MADSENQGFAVLDRDEMICRVRYLGNLITWKKGEDAGLPEGICRLMETVCRDYGYLIG